MLFETNSLESGRILERFRYVIIFIFWVLETSFIKCDSSEITRFLPGEFFFALFAVGVAPNQL